MNKFNKKNKMVLIVIILIVFSLVTYYIYANSDEEDVVIFEEEKKEEKQIEEKEKTIVVHIDGCVVNPGIIELNENSRISDAIEKAGGLMENADLTNVNLAYKLNDGIKIYIPSNNDIKEDNVMTENTVIQNMNIDTNDDEMVNINTADLGELEKLPGIGEATAKKILDYRDKNGRFNDIEEIKNIKGIGQAKYDQIKELIHI